MENFQIIILLMFSAAILVGMSQKIGISYPIALVVGGTVMGFIPGLPEIKFDPRLILFIVLPPILYYAAFGISFREFKKNWRHIFSLALGLVFVTTLVAGVVFKWLFPQYTWALAFAFGAIVSPPDVIAANSILKRFSISSRLLTVLEGESLINDASALVLYRMAVVAILTGTFSIFDGTLEFFSIVSGGVVIGFICGFILQSFSRYLLDPVVGVVFSFTIPYVTFIFADFLGFSGVLAVVVNGLIGSQFLNKHHSSLRRVLGFAVWDIFTIFLNCFVFIMIGLQLRVLVKTMTVAQMALYTGYGILMMLILILVRMIWIYASSAIIYLQESEKLNKHFSQTIRDSTLMGWSGMRGIVSLVAALALPWTLSDGSFLMGRNEVIFITFVVIFLSLLVPGLTLPLLIRFLNIKQQGGSHVSHRIRNKLAKIAEDKIDELATQELLNKDELNFLKSYFCLQRDIVEITHSEHKKFQNLETARLQIIQAQRKTLLEMWEMNEIDDKLLTRLEHELDVEETRIARVQL